MQSLETRTDAEVVVVAAARSATWRATSLGLACVGGLAMLVVVLFADRAVHPAMVPVDVVIGGVLAYGVGRAHRVIRLLVPRKVRRRVVSMAARDAFVTEAVHATPQRSGVLVYVSALEGEVVVVPDVGIQGLVPQGEWRAAVERIDARSLDGFLAGLAALGDVLAAHVPPTDAPHRVSLPDAPVVRP